MKKKNMNKIIDISIVIPTKNEASNIGRCLKSVYSQETPYSFEVIVIDSGSRDRTLHVVKRYPKVRLVQIEPQDFGHGKTRNMGARLARGRYIVFLNADAFPLGKKWLEPMILDLEEDNKTAGVFSRHIPRKKCHLYMVRDLESTMGEKRWTLEGTDSYNSMIFSTVSAAIRKDTWLKIPFDDDILIAEDQDWGWKVLDKGYNIAYEPHSQVFHSHNYKFSEMFRIKKLVGRSTRRFSSRFKALFVGLPLMMGGIIVKSWQDFIYICTNRNKELSVGGKIKECFIAMKSRIAAFLGHYTGWVTR